jgi:hypothetical protein
MDRDDLRHRHPQQLECARHMGWVAMKPIREIQRLVSDPIIYITAVVDLHKTRTAVTLGRTCARVSCTLLLNL